MPRPDRGRPMLVLGTRPEIIKLSPLILAAAGEGHEISVVHTGQHYSRDLDAVFFEQLGLAPPDRNLEVGSASHGKQTGRMLEGLEAAMMEHRPPWVVVQGDTNSAMAGALAAAKLHIPVGHVEAGLRSHDRRMPEEVNRIMADHLADMLFPPTSAAAATLEREGIPEERILVTGNTVVDALFAHRDRAIESSAVLGRLGLDAGSFALATVHRQENVDVRSRFEGILQGMDAAAEALGVPVVYPMHPRSRARMASFGLEARNVRVVDPLDYLDFLRLEMAAKIILTDSGGVQEEACILGVPCVTLRDNTERPETIEVGANRLAGAKPGRIAAAALEADQSRRSWDNPFGDGQAAPRILQAMAALAP